MSPLCEVWLEACHSCELPGPPPPVQSHASLSLPSGQKLGWAPHNCHSSYRIGPPPLPQRHAALQLQVVLQPEVWLGAKMPKPATDTSQACPSRTVKGLHQTCPAGGAALCLPAAHLPLRHSRGPPPALPRAAPACPACCTFVPQSCPSDTAGAHLQHCHVLLQLALSAAHLCRTHCPSDTAGPHLQHCDVLLQLALQAPQLLRSALRPGPRSPHLAARLHTPSGTSGGQPHGSLMFPAHAGAGLATQACGAAPDPSMWSCT